jgi:hypothetical protein
MIDSSCKREIQQKGKEMINTLWSTPNASEAFNSLWDLSTVAGMANDFHPYSQDAFLPNE